MGLFKPDLYRYFTIGFAAGALLVVATMNGSMGSNLADSMVPAAEAQPAQLALANPAQATQPEQ